MHSYRLCSWCLRRFYEAERVSERMLWLNPTDNQWGTSLIGEKKEKTAREYSENQ